jgi:pimeloyl-ACP methyl ester carboxylesterase
LRLVEDIRAFLDAMHIDRVDLIGHSIAGVEMTRFAAKYPVRVRHVVYLDAAYDMGAARSAGEGKWYKAFELGYKGEQIAIFERDMKRGRVVEFRDTDHFFFNDPNKVDSVVETIRVFLAKR